MLSAQGRRIVFLTVVVLALGSYTYLTTPETNEAVGEGAFERRVLEFNLQEVVMVEVVHEGEGLVCQQTPEGWKMKPSMKEFRAGEITDFLQSLQRLVVIGEVGGGAEALPEYGLDRPTTRISLHFEGGGSHTLAVGIHNPVHTSVYAQVDDAPRVVLVGSVILWEVRKLFIVAKG